MSCYASKYAVMMAPSNDDLFRKVQFDNNNVAILHIYNIKYDHHREMCYGLIAFVYFICVVDVFISFYYIDGF